MLNRGSIILEMRLALTLDDLKRPITVAVYRKTLSGKKYYMMVTDKSIDIVNNAAAKKPVIPHNYTIERLGVGESFINRWCKQFGIKTFEIVAK